MKLSKISLCIKQNINNAKPQLVVRTIKLTQSAPDLGFVLGCPMWAVNQFRVMGEL